MKLKNKIVLLFPDGVGIRNYLYSDVFKGKEENLILLHNFDSNTESEIKKITKIEDSFKLATYNESLKEKFLRELICLARLKSNVKLVQNDTVLSNWNTNHKKLKNKLFYKFIEFCTFFIFSYNQILFLENKYQKAIRKTNYYKKYQHFFRENNIKELFCSHQRGVQCATIFAACNDLGIKTTTVIYSWDNLPKARLALRANQYLVWSEYMKNELILYYPEINENRIFITGTPQFECYQNTENIIPKEDFYKEYNLDLDKKIICYSGDDEKTCPDDPLYLTDLADELTKNKLDSKYQILLRRCPVDISGRFDSVVNKYPELIKEAPPLWNFKPDSNWTTIYPLPEDVKLLVSTVFYSDVVVNLGSTMAFDFAMYNKPCVYINYDQNKKTNPDWSVGTIYKFQHFKSMPNVNVVYWWNSKEMLSNILKLNFKEEMSTWTDIILGDHKNSSFKISKLLN